jgi:hypothetical protein
MAPQFPERGKAHPVNYRSNPLEVLARSPFEPLSSFRPKLSSIPRYFAARIQKLEYLKNVRN